MEIVKMDKVDARKKAKENLLKLSTEKEILKRN